MLKNQVYVINNQTISPFEAFSLGQCPKGLLRNRSNGLLNIDKFKITNFKDLYAARLEEIESLIENKKSYNQSANSELIVNNNTSAPTGLLVSSASQTIFNSPKVSDEPEGYLTKTESNKLGKCAAAQIKVAKLFSNYITKLSTNNDRLHHPMLDAVHVGVEAYSACSHVPSGTGSNRRVSDNDVDNKGLTKRFYINLLTPFIIQGKNNINIKYENFQFKKVTYNKFIYAMEKAANILNLAFKSSGCLISKPNFTIAYKGFAGYTANKRSEILSLNAEHSVIAEQEYATVGQEHRFKVIIHLFYYVKKESLKYNFNQSVYSPTRREEGALANSTVELIKNSTISVPALREADMVEPKYTNILSILNDKLLYLSDYLTKLFNTNIEIELVRLYKSYQDSNILVQQLNSESYNKKFIKIISRLFKTINIYKNKGLLGNSVLPLSNDAINQIKTIPADIKNTLTVSTGQGNSDQLSPACSLQFGTVHEGAVAEHEQGHTSGNISFPSRVSGLNIKLAGRTIKERVIPRLTVKRAQRGSLNRLNAKLIEKSMFTDKSRKGAFNFTVTLSHVFK